MSTPITITTPQMLTDIMTVTTLDCGTHWLSAVAPVLLGFSKLTHLNGEIKVFRSSLDYIKKLRFNMHPLSSIIPMIAINNSPNFQPSDPGVITHFPETNFFAPKANNPPYLPNGYASIGGSSGEIDLASDYRFAKVYYYDGAQGSTPYLLGNVNNADFSIYGQLIWYGIGQQ